MKLAERLQKTPPYHFARWALRIAEVRETGKDIIRLDLGNPDLPPPDEVIAALSRSASEPTNHGYAGFRGLPALRQAIADHYSQRFGVTVDLESQVLPLLGSKEGIVHLCLACLDPGDLVLVPDPGYAPYTIGATLAGAGVHTLPLLAERSFLPDLGAIPSAVADRAVLMWLNYPNNPTGAIAPREFLAEAVAFAAEHDILLCHDAPYCDVTFDGYRAPSLLEVPGAAETALEFNSLSKTWNMAGWRVGMAVGNAEAVKALARIKSNVDTGIFQPVQEAAIRALTVEPDWLAARNRTYQDRLEILLDGLAAAGLPAERPRASLYLWVPVAPPTEEFADALLAETGVAIAPGAFFGPSGEGFVRLAVITGEDRLREAMERLKSFTTRFQ